MRTTSRVISYALFALAAAAPVLFVAAACGPDGARQFCGVLFLSAICILLGIAFRSWDGEHIV